MGEQFLNSMQTLRGLWRFCRDDYVRDSATELNAKVQLKDADDKGKPEMNKIVHLIPDTMEGLKTRGEESEKPALFEPSEIQPSPDKLDDTPSLTNAQAAKLAGVSRQSILTAKRLLSVGNDNLLNAVMQHGMSNGYALAIAKLPVDDQFHAIQDFIDSKEEGARRVKRKATEKKAVEKSKKENAGIDVTCVDPGESPLLTIARINNGLNWAINFFKDEVERLKKTDAMEWQYVA